MPSQQNDGGRRPDYSVQRKAAPGSKWKYDYIGSAWYNEQYDSFTIRFDADKGIELDPREPIYISKRKDSGGRTAPRSAPRTDPEDDIPY